MNILQDILQVIEQAEKRQDKIPLDDTLQIIKAYRSISKDPEIIDKMVYLILLFSKQQKHLKRLSARENQILNLIGLSFKSKEIAAMLTISEATVSTHRKNIIRKLQISGMGQLQNFAYQYARDKGKD